MLFFSTPAGLCPETSDLRKEGLFFSLALSSGIA
jgi:hypothetical protein